MHQQAASLAGSRRQKSALKEKPARIIQLPAETVPHLQRTLRSQWKRYRKELKRCQRNFSEPSVHEFRVVTRRLLAMVELLGGLMAEGRFEKVQRVLKRQRDLFDELRDTQVQLATVSRLRRAFPAARPFHAYLAKREQRLIRRTRRDIKHLKTRRLSELMSGCRQEVARQYGTMTPPRANARVRRAVDRAFARTARLRAGIDREDTQTIHRTRVAFKKFRYMIETLAGCLPWASPRFLEALRHYQTMMGDIQDAEVLLAAFGKFLSKQKLDPEAPSRLLAELLRRRQRLIEAYLEAADHLLEFWPGSGIVRAANATGEKGSRHARVAAIPAG